MSKKKKKKVETPETAATPQPPVKPAGYFQDAVVTTNQAGQTTGIKMNFTPKQALLFQLMTFVMNSKVSKEVLAEIKETKEYLEEHLVNITLRLGETPGTISTSFQCSPDNVETADKIRLELDKYFVSYAIARLLGKEKDYLRQFKDKKSRELNKAIRSVDEGTIERRDKIKHSAHLREQTLKYNYPSNGQLTLNLYDELSQDTRERFKREGLGAELINKRGEGIKLSKGEYKVVDCLSELLHDKSQTVNSEKDNYYSGNSGAGLIPWGQGEAIAPKLIVSLYELTKLYKGGEKVSGKDMENVEELLVGLDENPEKRALIRYTRTTDKPGGGKITDSIEEYQPLIKLMDFKRDETDASGKVISRKGELVIMLNPVFRDQLESKFILFPRNLTKLMITAYGNPNISTATYRLRDYLAGEHSAKRYKPEIYLDRLRYKLAEEYIQQGRKGLVNEHIDKAIETAKRYGLLDRVETVKGKTGADKLIFHLNKEWI